MSPDPGAGSMPPLLEKEAAALGPGVARGGDGELPGGASAPDLVGEAMAPVVAAVAGPVLGLPFFIYCGWRSSV